MLRTMIAAGALVLALALPGAAGAQSLMSDWARADMRGLLTEAGAKVTDEGTLDNGNPYFDAESSEGLKFHLYGAASEGEGAAQRCSGAELSTSFALESNEAVAEKLAALDFAAVAIFKGGDKSLRVTRYLIFDHGIARDNAKLNITVFLDIAHEIWDGL